MAKRKKGRLEKSQSAPNGAKHTPARKRDWLAVLTLMIAAWGAILSTYTAYNQHESDQPKIYVRLDVEAKGLDGDGEPVGNIVVLLSNIGSSTFSIAPFVEILASDPRSGELTRSEATFTAANKEFGEVRENAKGAPVTLKAGDEAVATTTSISLARYVNPLGYYSVIFTLSDDARYSAFFALPEYIVQGEDKAKLGWSGGQIANRL